MVLRTWEGEEPEALRTSPRFLNCQRRREGCQVQLFTYGVSSKGIGGRERVLRSFNEDVCSALPFRPSSSSYAPPTF